MFKLKQQVEPESSVQVAGETRMVSTKPDDDKKLEKSIALVMSYALGNRATPEILQAYFLDKNLSSGTYLEFNRNSLLDRGRDYVKVDSSFLTATRNTKGTESETTSIALCSLITKNIADKNATSVSIKSTFAAIGLISSRTFLPAIYQAYLQPNVGGTYLELNRSTVTDAARDYVRFDASLLRAIRNIEDTGLNKYFLKLAEDLKDPFKNNSQTKRQLNSVTTVLSKLADKSLFPDAIRAYLSPQATAGNYLELNRSTLTDANRNYMRADQNVLSALRTVNELNLEKLFSRLSEQVCGKESIPAISTALTSLLRDPTNEESRALLQKVCSQATRDDLFADITSAVDGINDRVRKLTFQNDVFEAASERKTVTEIIGKGREYKLLDSEDTDIRDQALVFVNAKRSLEALTNAVEVFNKSGFEAASASLSPLFSSRNKENIEVATKVLTLFAKNEIEQVKERIYKRFDLRADLKELQNLLSDFPFRSDIGDVSYRDTYAALTKELGEAVSFFTAYQRLVSVNEIRNQCNSGDYTECLKKIAALDSGLPDDGIVRENLIQEIKLKAAEKNIPMFDELFGDALSKQINLRQATALDAPNLGKNIAAARFLTENFKMIFNPLLQTARFTPTTAYKINAILDENKVGDRPKDRVLRYLNFDGQRALTDFESEYLQSVDRLTSMNPALTALLTVIPEQLSEFMYAHFDKLSTDTRADLILTPYIPFTIVGAGPAGIAAQARIVRSNPLLAHHTVLADQQEIPGGPFAVPEGSSWELNSASFRGQGFQLPRLLTNTVPVEQRIEAYAGYRLLTSYPGERNEASRRNSINQIADFLVAPDKISSLRYPTNADLALVAQTQAAMLFKKTLMNAEFVSFSKNTDPSIQGSKIINFVDQNTGESISFGTDGIIFASGFGPANFGFEVKGSKAEQIIYSETAPGEFPALSTTLGAFLPLSSRRLAPIKRIGETIVIWGSGNSTDTLLEYFGKLFSEANPIVGNVQRIFVISESPSSLRPRYAKIVDLKARNGGTNLIIDIQAKVTDVTRSDSDRSKLTFVGKDGQLIRDGQGNVLVADHGIAAAGFKSVLKKALQDYQGMSQNEAPSIPLTLPTNGALKIGEQLRDDPDVLILGTASVPVFNAAKKSQLPVEAANALGRVGGENAVALGFRIPETLAAVEAWLRAREFELPPIEISEPNEVFVLSPMGSNMNPDFSTPINKQGLPTLQSIDAPAQFASALLCYLTRAENISFQNDFGRPFTGRISFVVKKDQENLLIVGEQQLSIDLTTRFKTVFANPTFQASILKTLESKRRDNTVTVDIDIKQGSISFAKSLIE